LNITVIIPFFNSAAFLRAAVQSVVDTGMSGEILLIDDCSTDDSLSIAKKLEQEFPLLRVISQGGQKSKGSGAARNIGIREARFPYLAFLDADDLYFPNRFTDALAILEQQEEMDGVYGSAEIWDSKSGMSLGKKEVWEEIVPEDLFKELLLGRKGHFNTPAITLRKSVFDKSGLFNENLLWHQDTELWLRLAFHCKLARIPSDQPLARIVKHRHNHSLKSTVNSRKALWLCVLGYYKNRVTGFYPYYLMLLRLGTEMYKPPTKKEWLSLFPLFFRYPKYFWVLVRKWLSR
jgi:glycosyltransferase involved in cell wall biosynthesis